MSTDQEASNNSVYLAMEDEVWVVDQQRSDGVVDVCGTGEDSEGYFSARSNFSDDGETSVHALVEAAQTLTKAENQRLNAKIDRLMAALDGGRQVRFEHNPVTGYFDASTSYPAPSLKTDGSELEADIARAPQNFGSIISSRRQIIRSPTSMQYAMTSSSFSSEIRYETWEEAIAAADERYARENGIVFADQEDELAGADLRFELEQEASLRNGHKIRRALRLQEQALEEPRGRRVAVMGPADVEIYEIHPVQLDFNKALRTSTPSVYSSDNHLATSSPLFKVAYPDMVQYADSWATTSDSDEVSEHAAPSDRISEWLERVETPPQARTPMLLKGGSKDFNVFRDAAAGEGSSRTTLNVASTPKILREVTNLRRPGYLEHNSFAQEKKLRAGPLQAQGPDLPPHTFGGASDRQGRRSFIRSEWPGLLSPILEQESSASSYKPLSHPERVAHFKSALARLEGRASPKPSSPIRRYVHSDGVYGDDVEVDLRLVRFRQPRPVRCTVGPSVVQHFEKALGEDVDPKAQLKDKKEGLGLD